MEMRSIRVPWSCMVGLVGSAALAFVPWSASLAWTAEVEATPPAGIDAQADAAFNVRSGGKLRRRSGDRAATL